MGLLDGFWRSRSRSVPPALHVTLWPAFEHFPKFAQDETIQGIRLNSAMMEASEIDLQFKQRSEDATVPLWFDIKGMQLRIREVTSDHTTDHLEFILNRPVEVKTPFIVDFKAGEDAARCVEIRNGTHFIFEGGPKYEVRAGESIHIRGPHEVGGPVFLDYEIKKIEKIVSLGFSRYYLSYVWEQSHVDQFREFIGNDAELRLKIENPRGLEWVASRWRPQKRTNLIAARGDLFIEVEYPHQVLDACKLIIEKDPQATVGSRMLLSVVPPKPKTLEFLYYANKHTHQFQINSDQVETLVALASDFNEQKLSSACVPSCADISDLAWLYEIGYRDFLLCDELCLEEKWLGPCVNMFDAFRNEVAK